MGRRYPVKGCLYLTPIGGESAFRLRVVGAVHLADLSGRGVLCDAHAADKVAITEADLPARRQTEKLFRRILVKIIPFDVKDPGEGNFSGPHCGILWMTGAIELLTPPFRVIVDHHAQGTEDGHAAGRLFIEVIPDAVL